MKKFFMACLFAATLSLSTTAFAQDQNSATLEVTYEHTAPSNDNDNDNDDESDDESDTTTYMLNIPTHATFTPNQVFPITADKNNIASDKKIVITVDYNKTLPGGVFQLYKNKGESTEEVMNCYIYTYTDDSKTTLNTAMYENTPVAEFESGSLEPTYGGYMYFEPEIYNQSSGTYKGIVHFNIAVTDL